MKNVFSVDQEIGKIAVIFPKATDIFMEYEIDFCCGGDRTLDEALKDQNIYKEEIMDRLNVAYDKFKKTVNDVTDWRTASFSNLIDYIVQKHHTFMKEELPITSELINKILKVHFIDNGELLTRLHKLFNDLKSDIEMHLIKEEEALFPLIKEYEKNSSEDTLVKALIVMHETENEHDNAGDILKEIRKITNGYSAPKTGCNSFKRTYEKLEAIESDLFQHIHLENNILFNRLNVK